MAVRTCGGIGRSREPGSGWWTGIEGRRRRKDGRRRKLIGGGEEEERAVGARGGDWTVDSRTCGDSSAFGHASSGSHNVGDFVKKGYERDLAVRRRRRIAATPTADHPRGRDDRLRGRCDARPSALDRVRAGASRGAALCAAGLTPSTRECDLPDQGAHLISRTAQVSSTRRQAWAPRGRRGSRGWRAWRRPRR